MTWRKSRETMVLTIMDLMSADPVLKEELAVLGDERTGESKAPKDQS